MGEQKLNRGRRVGAHPGVREEQVALKGTDGEDGGEWTAGVNVVMMEGRGTKAETQASRTGTQRVPAVKLLGVY